MKKLITLWMLILFITPAMALRADISGPNDAPDGRVDFYDLAVLAAEWLQEDEDGMELGPELVVNGGFDSADGWGSAYGWTIADGKATFVKGEETGENVFWYLVTPIEGIVAGKRYKVSVDVSGWSIAGETSVAFGIGSLDGGSEAGFQAVGDGTHEQVVQAGVGQSFMFVTGGDHLAVGDTFAIDNVSVKEVLAAGNPNSLGHPEGNSLGSSESNSLANAAGNSLGDS